MTVRKLENADVDGVMEVIEQARRFLALCGVDQWQNDRGGYPAREDIENDVKTGEGVVCTDGERICAYAYVSFRPDPDYKDIDGEWLDGGSYCVIHRVAVSDAVRGRGVAGMIISYAARECIKRGIAGIRIDTHKDNSAMQRMLEKNDFSPCGTVYIDNTLERIAFNKLVTEVE